MTEAIQSAMGDMREAMRKELEQDLFEQLDARALKVEDIGWKLITGLEPDENSGPTLDMVREISDKLRPMAADSPWPKRGAQLRHSYVFGAGMKFQGLGPQAANIINTPHNRAVLFSVDAYESNNLALFTDGNFIVLKNTRHKFIAVPVSQITGVITDPDDSSTIRFLKRTWNSNGEEREVWYPLARYKKEPGVRIPKSIAPTGSGQRVPVSQDHVAYIKKTNAQTGWTFGAPDSLAGFVWVKAYEGYLKDNTTLFHALAQFAWSLTSKTKNGANNAAAQVLRPGVGGTAVSAEGNTLGSVGVPSAQVNMNNGQPLIAAAAASYGVPTIALLSSPGATGGSYGAATTLDQPTLRGFEAVQDSWVTFYEEILRDLPNSPQATVEFPAIESDPTHKQITSIATAIELGLIWDDEGRAAVLDLLDVDKMHGGLPPKPEINGSVVSKPGAPAAGVVPDSSNGGETDHELDEDSE